MSGNDGAGIPTDAWDPDAAEDFHAAFVVAPPLVYDPELQVAGVDVSLLGRLPTRAHGLVGFCLGGHPAAECLLDATGSGTEHDIVVAIDESHPCHRRFAERLRLMIKPGRPVHVVALP